ncbi:MAG: sigma-70 family RNA polymerase sigma factor [Oscillospiraceae bacterium]|nr:sigma-70 family RNA polymerase sigma factor [Oscillospiraceae bacterium]
MAVKYEAERFPADTFSDEALCARAGAGDHDAEAALAARYYAMVRACARPLFLTGGDGEDLIQEGMFGLIRAIRDYRPDSSASFHTFAEVCIRNQLFSALRAAMRSKHAPLNESVSLDHPFFDSNSYTAGVFDMASADPELLIADRDYVRSVLERTKRQLSEFEETILEHYLDGLTCREIAALVGRPLKSVDNAVQRVRRKVAQQLDADERINR